MSLSRFSVSIPPVKETILARSPTATSVSDAVR
jgi:hypothetical protein